MLQTLFYLDLLSSFTGDRHRSSTDYAKLPHNAGSTI
jgi:hypothetical protein